MKMRMIMMMMMKMMVRTLKNNHMVILAITLRKENDDRWKSNKNVENFVENVVVKYYVNE